MSAQRGSKMCSSREANHADLLRINMPLRGVSTSKPHRLLRILKILDVLRIMPLFRNPILHQNARHPNGVEPVANLRSFDVVREPNVRPARKDQSRSAIVLGRVRRKHRKTRLADVSHANGNFTPQDTGGIRSRIDLRPDYFGGLRVAIGPQKHGLLLCESRRCKQKSEDKRRWSHAGMVEQINEPKKRLLDIAPVFADSHF